MSDIDDLIDPALLASLFDEAVEPPPPSLRARVLESARRTSRFVRFAPLIAAALDVDEASASAQLACLDVAERWTPAVLEGVTLELQVARVGPAVADHSAQFVRVAAGTAVPMHEHPGAELTIVLQGSCHDFTQGVTLRPGSEQHMPAGSAHAFDIREGAPFIALLMQAPAGR